MTTSQRIDSGAGVEASAHYRGFPCSAPAHKGARWIVAKVAANRFDSSADFLQPRRQTDLNQAEASLPRSVLRLFRTRHSEM